RARAATTGRGCAGAGAGAGAGASTAGARAIACAFRSQVAGAVARQRVVGVLAAVAVHRIFVPANAAASGARVALLRGARLLALQLFVKLLDRSCQPAVDLGTLLGGRACRRLGLSRARTT